MLKHLFSQANQHRFGLLQQCAALTGCGKEEHDDLGMTSGSSNVSILQLDSSRIADWMMLRIWYDQCANSVGRTSTHKWMNKTCSWNSSSSSTNTAGLRPRPRRCNPCRWTTSLILMFPTPCKPTTSIEVFGSHLPRARTLRSPGRWWRCSLLPTPRLLLRLLLRWCQTHNKKAKRVCHGGRLGTTTRSSLHTSNSGRAHPGRRC